MIFNPFVVGAVDDAVGAVVVELYAVVEIVEVVEVVENEPVDVFDAFEEIEDGEDGVVNVSVSLVLALGTRR